MPAAIFLDPAHLEVEPGREASATITVRNTGQIVDEFRFDVVGVPAAWAVVTPASISLFPGAGGAVQVRFAPPRAPGVAPGVEGFGIRVRSSADPSFSFVEEGEVRVLPFGQLAARLVPRTSRASLLGRRARHRLVVENAGNAPLPVDAAAADPDESLHLELAPASVVVNPGASAELGITARAPGRVMTTRAHAALSSSPWRPAPGHPDDARDTGRPRAGPAARPGRLDPLLPATGTPSAPTAR
jgi:hypothetical protein